MSILQIALDVPLPRLFDYRLDGESAGNPTGRLVRVPFGTGNRIGVVLGEVAQSDQPPDKLKTAELIADLPALPDDWIALCRFCAQYYHHPLGQVMAFALPPLLRKGKTPRALKPKVSAGETAPSSNEATADQAAAIAAIVNASGFQTFLLHGVTGSGKTEVYLAAAAAVVAAGGQALLLVPEINLTPQFVARVAAALPNARTATLHSALPDGERRANWEQAARGEADLVLGTRLAVFAALPRLALIVVDEEHDGSYKQHDGVRYHARDAAVWRAHRLGIPVVLGSATPSLESHES